MKLGEKDTLRKIGNFLLSISAIVVLLIVWQIAVDSGLISERKLAPPTKVLEESVSGTSRRVLLIRKRGR